MNKLVILLICFFSAASMMAQNMTPADKIAEQDLEIMSMKIQNDYPNLAFNQAQTQQLKAVLIKRAKEVYSLRQKQDLTKLDYNNSYKDLASKYEDKLLAIMSAEQRKAYLGNKKVTAKRK